MKDIDKLSDVEKRLKELKTQSKNDDNVGRTIDELEKAVQKARSRTPNENSNSND